MKSPEEIKKGLECCQLLVCHECPYSSDKPTDCQGDLKYDALEYIEKLEKRCGVFFKGIDEAVGIIGDLKKLVPRWIPATEKLPEELRYVLAIDYYDECSWEPCIAFVQKGQWKSWELFGVVHRITHWMPLPEPPKEVRE